MVANLRELLQYSHLILSFAGRDIRVRYKESVLGAAWAILQPLSLMVVFTFVFGTLTRVPTDGVPYPVFAYSALVFWTFFARTTMQGTLSMTANATLVRKVFFPREVLLLAALVSASFDLAVACLFLLGLLLYYQIAVTWVALLIVPLLVTQAVFTLALVAVTSCLHVRFRDIAHALPLVLQLWMFVSPVAYPLSVVPPPLRTLYLLNPMTPIIEGYRRVIVHHTAPDLPALAGALAIGLVLLSLAYLVFKRAERTFADVI